LSRLRAMVKAKANVKRSSELSWLLAQTNKPLATVVKDWHEALAPDRVAALRSVAVLQRALIAKAKKARDPKRLCVQILVWSASLDDKTSGYVRDSGIGDLVNALELEARHGTAIPAATVKHVAELEKSVIDNDENSPAGFSLATDALAIVNTSDHRTLAASLVGGLSFYVRTQMSAFGLDYEREVMVHDLLLRVILRDLDRLADDIEREVSYLNGPSKPAKKATKKPARKPPGR
jgi:hypothetical protein